MPEPLLHHDESPAVVVPSTLREACQALHQAEAPLRTIAMFRSRAEATLGGHDDDSVHCFLERNHEKETQPWVREQMIVCGNLLSRQDELQAKAAALRHQLMAPPAGFR